MGSHRPSSAVLLKVECYCESCPEQVYDMDLDVGDVIVMATDGLFDNVWDDDITALVLQQLQVSTLLLSYSVCQ